jgi:hypothetical protein
MDIVKALLRGRNAISDTPTSNGTGIYAIFAKHRDCLPGIDVPETGVVYVGMTEDSLASRNHFLAQNSGFHSPRRSLGAILKQELGLEAVPRSPGPSTKNYDCYSFYGDGDQRLSTWMSQNLDYAVVELNSDLRNIEKAVISEMKPPLNLTGWPNPQKRHIMDLRSACKAEAKAARLGPRRASK